MSETWQEFVVKDNKRILELVKDLIRTLPVEMREEVFSGFGEFCKHCGELTNGKICYCIRDD